MAIEIWIAGIPKSTQTGSVVRAGNRLIPIRLNTEWSGYVKLAAREQAPAALLNGPLEVTYDFYLPRAAKPKHPTWPIARPDVDNLLKGLSDSLNGILWHDDSQIVSLAAHKHFADASGPGLRITVCAW